MTKTFVLGMARKATVRLTALRKTVRKKNVSAAVQEVQEDQEELLGKDSNSKE